MTGLGRGGTSSIASMLLHAGFDLSGGERMSPTLEDKYLRGLLVKADFEQLTTVLEARAKQYPLMAWKDPKLRSNSGLELVRRLPDDWTVIVIYRDPVAVTSRRVVSDGVDFADQMAKVMRFMGNLYEYAVKVGKTKKVLHVSYEKIMTEPTESITRVLNALGAELNAGDAAAIWQRMQENQQAYIGVAGAARLA